MQLRTNDLLSSSHHFTEFEGLHLRREESEDSLRLSVLLEGESVCATEALNVVKKKLFAKFAQAGVCDPEDLVSETLLKLWELHHDNPTLGNASIETTAREVYRSSLREKSRRAEVQIDFLPEIPSPAPAIDGNEYPRSFLESLLNVALNSLAELDQDILRSHLLNGRTFEELAGHSELSKSGIKIRHYRAIDKLRLAFLKLLITKYRASA